MARLEFDNFFSFYYHERKPPAGSLYRTTDNTIVNYLLHICQHSLTEFGVVVIIVINTLCSMKKTVVC